MRRGRFSHFVDLHLHVCRVYGVSQLISVNRLLSLAFQDASDVLSPTVQHGEVVTSFDGMASRSRNLYRFDRLLDLIIDEEALFSEGFNDTVGLGAWKVVLAVQSRRYLQLLLFLTA